MTTIPAAFFYRFFLWSFWSSSTLPRLVCLSYVLGFYFLFCCVEVSSVVLCLLCYVALCCDPLCCVCFVALRRVSIHCVAVVLYLLSCVALCCIVIHCIVLHCDPLCCNVDKFSISSIPSMLKLCINRRTQPISLTGKQSLHQRTQQTQPPLLNR